MSDDKPDLEAELHRQLDHLSQMQKSFEAEIVARIARLDDEDRKMTVVIDALLELAERLADRGVDRGDDLVRSIRALKTRRQRLTVQ